MAQTIGEAPPPLPEFSNPPVSEVALSVAFEPLSGYTTAHAGLYWSGISDRFKRAEEHPPHEIPVEKDASEPARADIGIQLTSQFPNPRIWFLTEDQNELIQVQRDGFFRNWRQLIGDERYPRYDTLRQRFERDFLDFEAFVQRAQLGSIVPVRCEVVYVNHILAGSEWNSFGEIHKVIAACAPLRSEAFLSSPEECRYTAKFPMRDLNSGQFLGRLTVTATPAFRRRDKHPLISFILTARGRPAGASLSGVLDFFDIAHTWIVRGFTDLTTSAMH